MGETRGCLSYMKGTAKEEEEEEKKEEEEEEEKKKNTHTHTDHQIKTNLHGKGSTTADCQDGGGASKALPSLMSPRQEK